LELKYSQFSSAGQIYIVCLVVGPKKQKNKTKQKNIPKTYTDRHEQNLEYYSLGGLLFWLFFYSFDLFFIFYWH